MPTYNSGAVADTVIAYQKPITLQQGRGLRDNPLAIAEGAAGAPVVQTVWHPYNMTLAGTGDGEIWSFSADGAVASVETPNFEDGWEYRLVADELRGTLIAQTITIALYWETSASYAQENSWIGPLPAAAYYGSGFADILKPRETSRVHLMSGISASWTGSGNVGSASLFSGVSLHNTVSQKILKARISISDGTLDAGRIRFLRRKLYG